MRRRWWRTTVRSAAAEFGPPPGARYAVELSRYTDAQLLAADRDQVLAEVREYREAVARIVKQAHEREVTR